MKAPYLVCYDICDHKRLQKVFKFMKGRGVHLQYSIFHCALSWQGLKELKEGIEGIINPEEDDVRIYPLPSQPEVLVLGCGARVPDGVILGSF